MVTNSRAELRRLAATGKDLSFDELILPAPQLYVLFSFDLVNSTVYKNKQTKIWPSVFAQFYQVIKGEMKQRFHGIKILKYIGDEIIFFKEIISTGDLFEVIPGASEVLTSTLEQLGDLYNENFKPLSLKGTIWCAPVTVCKGEELKNLKMEGVRNIALDVVYENEVSLRDFMGPDIDIGFRISKYAEKEKLVISADLAYLLLKTNPPKNIMKAGEALVQNLRIVSYEDLKGIWDERYYPIIWYYNDWESIEDTFEYDDRFKHKIINNICLKQAKSLENLTGIFTQLGITDEKNKLLTILEESEVLSKKEKLKKQTKIPVIRDREE